MAKVASTVEMKISPNKGDLTVEKHDSTDNSSDSMDPNGPTIINSLLKKHNAAKVIDPRHSTVDTIQSVASSDFGLKGSSLKFDPNLFNFSEIEYTENGTIWLYEKNSSKFLLIKDDRIVDEFDFPDGISAMCSIEN